MFRKKGQAAMEFLMTYGWAILVVLVAIGALAYFGVLDPSKFLPERCTGPSGMDCVDKASLTDGTAVAAGTIQFAFKNNQGFGVEINTANIHTALGTDCGTPSAAAKITSLNSNCTGAAAINDCLLPNGDQATVTITCAVSKPTSGRVKEDIYIPYINAATGLLHNNTISITGRAP